MVFVIPTTGAEGPAGPAGPQGIQGIQGIQGVPGPATGVFQFPTFFGGTLVLNQYLLVNGEASSASLAALDERAQAAIAPLLLNGQQVRPFHVSWYGSAGASGNISIIKTGGTAPGTYATFPISPGFGSVGFTGGPGTAWQAGDPVALQVSAGGAGQANIALWWLDAGVGP